MVRWEEKGKDYVLPLLFTALKRGKFFSVPVPLLVLPAWSDGPFLF